MQAKSTETNRFGVSTSAGQRDGCRFAVIDRHDQQGGKGARRVSWHRTAKQAQSDAQRRNAQAARIVAQAGVTEAYFEPRNRWGAAAIHAVREITYTNKRGTHFGTAFCGAEVQVMEARSFEVGNSTACKRCSKAVR